MPSQPDGLSAADAADKDADLVRLADGALAIEQRLEALERSERAARATITLAIKHLKAGDTAKALACLVSLRDDPGLGWR